MAERNGGSQPKQGKQQQGRSSSGGSGESQSQGQEQSSGGEQKQQEAEKKGQQKGAEKGEKGQRKEQPSRMEWIVGIACSVVVLTAVGYLFYTALSRPSLPPMITVHVERVAPIPNGFLVEFRAVNEGSRTASNLMVEGALMQDTTEIEKSTATLDFVPADTERQGGLFFTRDPRRYRLAVRPTGYDLP